MLGQLDEVRVVFFFFFGRCTACGILVPRPGIEPGPSAVTAQSPNHRTAREFPMVVFLTHGTGTTGYRMQENEVGSPTSHPIQNTTQAESKLYM